MMTSSQIDDPELKALQEAVKASPDDLAAYKALARALVIKVRESDPPSMPVIMAAIKALRDVLDRDPKDSEALLAMANISFSSNVFDKAASLYERYLAIKPNDLTTRSEYGGVLIALGRFDEAKRELNVVLKEDPDHFQALVNLAIVYGQTGDEKEFESFRRKALAKAPEQEKARLESLFERFEIEKAKTETKNYTPRQP